MAALTIALTFLFIDNAKRISLVRRVSQPIAADRPAPLPDANSPTGYAAGQHRLVIPWDHADAYNWIMQAERMVAGDGVRIRHSDIDNAPTGRPVHWSGSVRWWLVAVAWSWQRFHPDSTLPLAIESVAPWAGTAALALFLLLITPLLARRLGAAAAALFALGSVAVFGFYQYSTVLDHHAFAAMSSFAAVAFLVAGGSGWVGTRTHARRWFVAAGLAGGTGLWISAATLAPVLVGIGIGALVSNALLSRAPHAAGLEPAPELWRLWGITGFLVSLGYYLVEYFPAHIGMRLEVNHPLYGIAWLAGGDLLCRVARSSRTHAIANSSSVQRHRNEWAWRVVDLIGIALLPAIILLAQARTFMLTDPFLWALHVDYIAEFRNLGGMLAQLNPASMLPLATPVALLPVIALLWQTPLTTGARLGWHAAIALLCVLAFVFVHGIFFYSALFVLQSLGMLPASPFPAQLAVNGFAITADALVLAGLWRFASRTGHLSAPAQAALLISVTPAVLLLALSYQQARWFGIASTLSLAAFVAVPAVLRSDFRWTPRRRALAASCAGLILLPFPVLTILGPWRYGYPDGPVHEQWIIRDLAHFLRAREREAPVVVLSSPTTTTWLSYFGGFPGIGTLYWENVEGLKTAAQIYAAPSDEQAKQLIDRHGITHIVIPSWQPFVREFNQLARENLAEPAPTSPNDTFAARALDPQTRPRWLTPVPYALPDKAGTSLTVTVLKVQN